MEKKDENENKGGKKGKKVTAKPSKVCDSCFDGYDLFVKKKKKGVCNLKGILMLTGGRWNWRERTREVSEERQEGTAQGQIKIFLNVYVCIYALKYILWIWVQ